MIFIIYILPLNLDVFVYQKSNIKYSKKLISLFKLFAIENKIYKI